MHARLRLLGARRCPAVWCVGRARRLVALSGCRSAPAVGLIRRRCPLRIISAIVHCRPVAACPAVALVCRRRPLRPLILAVPHCRVAPRPAVCPIARRYSRRRCCRGPAICRPRIRPLRTTVCLPISLPSGLSSRVRRQLPLPCPAVCLICRDGSRCPHRLISPVISVRVMMRLVIMPWPPKTSMMWSIRMPKIMMMMIIRPSPTSVCPIIITPSGRPSYPPIPRTPVPSKAKTPSTTPTPIIRQPAIVIVTIPRVRPRRHHICRPIPVNVYVPVARPPSRLEKWRIIVHRHKRPVKLDDPLRIRLV